MIMMHCNGLAIKLSVTRKEIGGLVRSLFDKGSVMDFNAFSIIFLLAYNIIRTNWSRFRKGEIEINYCK